MLHLEIPESEYYSDQKEEFIKVKKQTLYLEHSLVSISKWEAKHAKPFLKEDNKTSEEFLDYIRYMVVNKYYDPNFVYILTSEQINEISHYINTSQTATWFSKEADTQFKKINGRENGVITSEVIYYLMVACQIPFECQKWHLSRLITLIRVYQEKNKEATNSNKALTKSQILERNRALNDARRKALKTKG